MSDGTHLGNEPPSERSMEGASSDQKLAAIMTPAAKPSIASKSLRLTFLVPNTSAAPSAVIPHVNSVAKAPARPGEAPQKPLASRFAFRCWQHDTAHSTHGRVDTTLRPVVKDGPLSK
jgi:hypothetical protein